jgi:small subunit ribosomal protein S17
MDTKKTQTNIDTVKKAKTFKGIVVSSSMKDTVSVEISRYVKHPKYGKYIKHSKKIKAHDAGNTKKVGDNVVIVETKPLSKGKSFIVA